MCKLLSVIDVLYLITNFIILSSIYIFFISWKSQKYFKIIFCEIVSITLIYVHCLKSIWEEWWLVINCAKLLLRWYMNAYYNLQICRNKIKYKYEMRITFHWEYAIITIIVWGTQITKTFALRVCLKYMFNSYRNHRIFYASNKIQNVKINQL